MAAQGEDGGHPWARERLWATTVSVGRGWEGERSTEEPRRGTQDNRPTGRMSCTRQWKHRSMYRRKDRNKNKEMHEWERGEEVKTGTKSSALTTAARCHGPIPSSHSRKHHSPNQNDLI